MVDRDLAPQLRKAAEAFPAVTLTGPRQSGKSTLCRGVFPDRPYVNLESPDVRAFAIDDPRGFLAAHAGGAILDEVQRAPDLPSWLQPIIDDDPAPGRWILTGSQHLPLSETIGQSLAGRTRILHLLPLARPEVERFTDHPTDFEGSLLAGGYPRICDQGIEPGTWLQSYVATYIERDVRTISNVGNLTKFQRFVQLCAGRTANLLNLSGLAGDAGITQPTARTWLSILETTFLVHRLPAFHTNERKRLVKMPKLHFHDVGLAAWLLGIRRREHLDAHPLRGSLFETWVVSEIFKHRSNRGETAGMFTLRDRDGREADVLVETGDRRLLVEVKASRTIPNGALGQLESVAELLPADGRPVHRIVVYAGDESQRRSDGEIVSWRDLASVDWVT
ncbi:MAG: ATP-binding protein [Phycisphaerales bacterium]